MRAPTRRSTSGTRPFCRAFAVAPLLFVAALLVAGGSLLGGRAQTRAAVADPAARTSAAPTGSDATKATTWIVPRSSGRAGGDWTIAPRLGEPAAQAPWPTLRLNPPSMT